MKLSLHGPCVDSFSFILVALIDGGKNNGSIKS